MSLSLWLTARQVADLLGKSMRTLDRWRRQGKLTGIQDPGGRWQYRRSAILRLAAGEIEQPTERARDIEAHVASSMNRIRQLRHRSG